MILYVNGDSHSAGAEAVNSYAFAKDDPLYYALGRQPHPDNERVSYGCQLANMMNAVLHCDAESASSNQRIIRTTWEYIKDHVPDFVVIGWSTWERKEFADPETGITWQVNAGGIGEDWPAWLKDLYPKYISAVDWAAEMKRSESEIYQFHQDLTRQGVRHLFFNTYNYFDETCTGIKFDWNDCYVDPYNPNGTYHAWCIQNGFKTVNSNSYHFGPDAHAAWAKLLYNQIIQMELTRLR